MPPDMIPWKSHIRITPHEKHYCKKDRQRKGKDFLKNASVINDKGYENIPE